MNKLIKIVTLGVLGLTAGVGAHLCSKGNDEAGAKRKAALEQMVVTVETTRDKEKQIEQAWVYSMANADIKSVDSFLFQYARSDFTVEKFKKTVDDYCKHNGLQPDFETSKKAENKVQIYIVGKELAKQTEKYIEKTPATPKEVMEANNKYISLLNEISSSTKIDIKYLNSVIAFAEQNKDNNESSQIKKMANKLLESKNSNQRSSDYFKRKFTQTSKLFEKYIPAVKEKKQEVVYETAK